MAVAGWYCLRLGLVWTQLSDVLSELLQKTGSQKWSRMLSSAWPDFLVRLFTAAYHRLYRLVKESELLGGRKLLSALQHALG